MQNIQRPSAPGPLSDRRQKVHERKQRFVAAYRNQQQQVMGHRRRLSNSSGSAEVSEDDSVTHSEGSSSQTPSEYSLHTPDEVPSMQHKKVFAEPSIRSGSFSDDESTQYMRNHLGDSTIGQMKPPMLSSLTTTADFNFDHFSTLEGASQPEDTDDDDLSSDEEIMYSPIEVAKPMVILLPKSRPAMISIPSPTALKRFSLDVNQMRQNHSIRETRPARASLQETSFQSFMVPEAVPAQVSHESSYDSESDNYSCQMSIHRATTEATPRRKSSLLFSKKRQSRMGSIKKLVRPTPQMAPVSGSYFDEVVEEHPTHSISEEDCSWTEPTMDTDMLDRVAEISWTVAANPISREFVLEDFMTEQDQFRSGSESAASAYSTASIRSRSSMRKGSSSDLRAAARSASLRSKRTVPHVVIAKPMYIEPPTTNAIETVAPPALSPRNPKRSGVSYSPFPQINPVISTRSSSLRSPNAGRN